MSICDIIYAKKIRTESCVKIAEGMRASSWERKARVIAPEQHFAESFHMCWNPQRIIGEYNPVDEGVLGVGTVSKFSSYRIREYGLFTPISTCPRIFHSKIGKIFTLFKIEKSSIDEHFAGSFSRSVLEENVHQKWHARPN